MSKFPANARGRQAKEKSLEPAGPRFGYISFSPPASLETQRAQKNNFSIAVERTAMEKYSEVALQKQQNSSILWLWGASRDMLLPEGLSCFAFRRPPSRRWRSLSFSGSAKSKKTEAQRSLWLCLPYEIHVNEERSGFHWGGEYFFKRPFLAQKTVHLSTKKCAHQTLRKLKFSWYQVVEVWYAACSLKTGLRDQGSEVRGSKSGNRK